MEGYPLNVAGEGQYDPHDQVAEDSMSKKASLDDHLLDAPPVAENGLLDRRALIRLAALGSVTGLVAGRARPSFAGPVGAGQPEWLLAPGLPIEEYGRPSRFEVERVKRYVWPLEKNRGQTIPWISFTPHDLLHGTHTPSGLHFEINHHGIPDIDPEQHELVIHGMVQRPLKFNVERLDRYPTVTHDYFVECAGNSGHLWNEEPVEATLALTHGFLSGSEWTGVPLAVLLDEAGVLPGARWVVAEGADSGSLSRSVPMEKALDDSLIALYQNGERVRPGQGYPMRLFNPGFEGNTSVKWVRSLRVTDRPAMTRFETSRYTDLMPDGKALQFTLEMEVKSVITRPSNSMKLKEPGYYEIAGLAWSGAGTIRRVEVSADAGQTWGDALLQEPVSPKMTTRFRMPWRWDGGPATLQSRATDETGRVQPTRQTLIAARGRASSPGTYHFNAIHSWGILPGGEIRHV
jgi:sulfane dehydrogenase subunit SoxC